MRAKQVTKVVGIGASTMRGHNVPYGSGWFDRLSSRFISTYEVPIPGRGNGVDAINLAQAGQTVDVFDRNMSSLIELYGRAPRQGRVAWILQLGNNEAWVDHYDSHMDSETFSGHMGNIAMQLLEADGLIVNVGTMPADEARVMRARNSGRLTASQVLPAMQFEDAGEVACLSAAGALGRQGLCHNVELYGAMLVPPGRINTALFGEDGIHPNIAGHSFIAGKVWAVLRHAIEMSVQGFPPGP